MATNTNNFSIRSVLEKDKLTGNNFLDWQRNLRIVLRQERKLYVIEIPRPMPLPGNASQAQVTEYNKHIDDDTDVTCLMLATMSAELQKQHEHMDAYEMIEHLKVMFEGQARQERYNTFQALSACKQGEKKSGHWKRNCHAFMEDLKNKKAASASGSGIYVIEVNLSTSTSWVLDT